MKKLSIKVLIVLVLITLSGCSHNSVKVVPYSTINMNSENVFYVIVDSKNQRNLDKLIIATLIKQGYKASSGKKENIPNEATVLITYEDKWMWDMRSFLSTFNVKFRNHLDEYPIIVGEALRASFAENTDEKVIVPSIISMMINKIKDNK